MNFKIKLFPDEHQAIINVLMAKMQSQQFVDLELGNKILYLESLRGYQSKVHNRIIADWKKTRREFSVSFKPYAAELLVKTIYEGSHHYNEHVRNIARILQNQMKHHAENANHYLSQLQNQLNHESQTRLQNR